MSLFTKRYFLNSVFLLVANTIALLSISAHAENVLQILPTRVVLENQQRWMTITLVNRGDEENSYRLFMRNIRAEKNGTFKEITAEDEVLEGELFAESMIRFSPRRVTVPARSKQQVRVVLRKPKGLADGEYRSHLVFRKLPKQESVLEEEQDEKMDFAFKPIVEVTIPVIVRHGNLNASIALSNLTLSNDEDNGMQAEIEIQRSGNRSLYGDIDIWWQPNNGEEQRIAYAKGIAVYTPNTNRKLTIGVLPDIPVTGAGILRAVFNEDPAYGGNQNAEITTTR
jgi:P pilus assembly chaperone PapD